MWQNHRLCVASRPSLVVICLKKFRKEFVVLEGRGPGARDNTKVRLEQPESDSAPAPGLAPPRLHGLAPQPASSQIFFHFTSLWFFPHQILFYLWILNLMFKNNWIYFYSCWKTQKVGAFWILFQISLNSIIRIGKTYLREQQTNLNYNLKILSNTQISTAWDLANSVPGFQTKSQWLELNVLFRLRLETFYV